MRAADEFLTRGNRRTSVQLVCYTQSSSPDRGVHKTAQGKARDVSREASPWDAIPNALSPERACHEESRTSVSPLQGSVFGFDVNPGRRLRPQPLRFAPG